MQDGETKYLVLNANCEDDTVVIVVEFTYDYAVQLLERIKWTEAGRAVDNDLARISFFANPEAYDISGGSTGFAEWLEEDLDREEAWDSNSWVCSDEKPDFPDSAGVRVEQGYLNVSAYGWIAWSLRPKHGISDYETTGIDLKTLEKTGLIP